MEITRTQVKVKACFSFIDYFFFFEKGVHQLRRPLKPENQSHKLKLKKNKTKQNKSPLPF